MDRANGPKWPIVHTNLFSDQYLNSLQWSPFRTGIEISWLYSNPQGPSAAFLRYAPGASLERHVHPGHEHILVLRGSQIDDAGEHFPGTLIIHGPGSSHAIVSPNGCIVMAVWEKPVHLPKPQEPALVRTAD
jgi:anti-sigma factor ChrR (cupin superfamily)